MTSEKQFDKWYADILRSSKKISKKKEFVRRADCLLSWGKSHSVMGNECLEVVECSKDLDEAWESIFKLMEV